MLFTFDILKSDKIIVFIGCSFVLMGCSAQTFTGSSGTRQRVQSPQEPAKTSSDQTKSNESVGDHVDWSQVGGWNESNDVNHSGKGLGIATEEAKTKIKKINGKIQNNKPGPEICACNWGQTPDGTHISGSRQKLTFNLSASHSFKVTGTGQNIDVEVKSPQSIEHLCVYMMGDQNRMNIRVLSPISVVYLVTAGNQPDIRIDVAKDQTIDTVKIHMTGSQGQIQIAGEGRHQCETVIKGGNNTATCQKAP